MLQDWFIIAIVVFAGATIQSAVGFGFGILIIPTLIYIDVQPEVAIMISVLLVTLPNILTLNNLYKHVHVPSMIFLIILGALVQPFGVWMLGQLKTLSPNQIKAFFGYMILFVLVLQFLFKVKPRKNLHTGWGVLAFTASGLMGGFCGMHGPPLVIWTMTHDWSTQRIRGSLMLCYVIWAPLLTGILWYQHPNAGLAALKQASWALPIALMGLWLGLYLGKHFSRFILRGLAFFLLAFVAILAIFG